MNNPLEMNIAGRTMLVLSRCGVTRADSVATYISAVSAAVHRLAADKQNIRYDSIARLIEEQLVLLENALRVIRGTGTGQCPTPSEAGVDTGRPSAPTSTRRANRRTHASTGYAPVARTLQDKLREDRERIRKLIVDDCVSAGLVDPDKAQLLVAGMAGKSPDDAEREIVAELQKALLDQVKGWVRETQGGPWDTPRLQADLHKNIYGAKTVRGVLMVARDLVKKHRDWQEVHGRGGILGLFAGRD